MFTNNMADDIEFIETQIVLTLENESGLYNAGRPGYNEFGAPLHACNGFRHDEHYWAYLANKRKDASSCTS